MNTKKLHNKKRRFFVLILWAFVAINGCKKEPTPQPAMETGTVTDIDGNVYGTIKIGNQWWMTENLKVKKYRDGTAITMITTPQNWKQDTLGGYCEYASDQRTGFLYNWYAINHIKSVAPEGWRIPSDEDWKELERNIGMSAEEAWKTGWRGTKEGDKLKIENTDKEIFWKEYGEVWPTNELGFKGMAGGYRMYDGTWGGESGATTLAFFWSSSIQNGQVWYRYLDYQKSSIFRYHGPKNYGFSVRCIKN